MDILIWTFIIACFVLSFIGLIYPIIPGVLMIWIGIIIYHFFIESSVSWWTWGAIALLTAILFTVDLLANNYFVQKFGGDKKTSRIAAIGLIIGCFVIPPFGVIVLPFLFVLLTELLYGKTFTNSIKIAVGTFIAFLSSTFAKALIQIAMIIVFSMNVFLF